MRGRVRRVPRRPEAAARRDRPARPGRCARGRPSRPCARGRGGGRARPTWPPSSTGSRATSASAGSRPRRRPRRACTSRAVWSTPTCPTCCRPAKRRSCRARSPRPSAWSRSKLPRVAHCRSRRLTPGWQRSPPRCAMPWTRISGRCSSSSAGRTPCARLRRSSSPGSRWTAARRAAASESLANLARARYGWESVAEGVIAAARGELADLPHPVPPPSEPF